MFRLPTLEERRRWNICCICFWEDDPHADTIGEYTLTEARHNFLKHVLMFPRVDPRFHDPALSGGRAMQAKRAIMGV